MQNNTIKKLSIICSVPLIICVIGNLVLLVLGNINNALGIHDLVNSSMNIFVAVFGVFYIFAGCTKEIGGELLKLYISFFALIQLFMLFDASIRNVAGLTIILAIKLALLAVLGLAKDVGEIKSKVISILVLLGTVGEILFSIFCLENVVYLIPRMTTAVFLAVSTLVLICAKYEDKRARGTK